MDFDPIDFYTNSVVMYSTQYEVTARFQNISLLSEVSEEDAAPGKLIGMCSIRMSPSQAKAVAALFLKHVLAYESRNDISLPMPPHVQEMWDEVMREIRDD